MRTNNWMRQSSSGLMGYVVLGIIAVLLGLAYYFR